MQYVLDDLFEKNICLKVPVLMFDAYIYL